MLNKDTEAFSGHEFGGDIFYILRRFVYHMGK